MRKFFTTKSIKFLEHLHTQKNDHHLKNKVYTGNLSFTDLMYDLQIFQYFFKYSHIKIWLNYTHRFVHGANDKNSYT